LWSIVPVLPSSLLASLWDAAAYLQLGCVPVHPFFISSVYLLAVTFNKTYISILTFRWPCIVINSCNKTNQMHLFLKFILGIKLYIFRTIPLSIIRGFPLYTQQCYMSYRFADSLRAGSGRSQPISKSVWHIPLLCVQWKTPDDGQRNCPRYVEFYSKNKFEKLVHLVGFIIRAHFYLFFLQPIIYYFDGLGGRRVILMKYLHPKSMFKTHFVWIHTPETSW